MMMVMQTGGGALALASNKATAARQAPLIERSVACPPVCVKCVGERRGASECIACVVVMLPPHSVDDWSCSSNAFLSSESSFHLQNHTHTHTSTGTFSTQALPPLHLCQGHAWELQRPESRWVSLPSL